MTLRLLKLLPALSLLGSLAGGCVVGDEDVGLRDTTDSGVTTANADAAGTAEAGRNPTYDDYLEFASRYCDGAAAAGASERVLLGQTVIPADGPMFFTGEPGTEFFYITESCDIYTAQRCKLTRETDDCDPFLTGQLPYTRTRLTSEELATLLKRMRVLEWSGSIDAGAQFELPYVWHGSFVLVWFGDLHFYLSYDYSAQEPWEDPDPDPSYGPDGWDVLDERDYLLHDAVSVFRTYGGGFRSPMHEMLSDAAETTDDKARVVLMEVSPDSDFARRQRHVYEWPLTSSPDDLRVLAGGEDYHFGTSNTVYGEDADGVRQLVSEIVASGIPDHERDRFITLRFEDRMFIMQMRETLPFEGENGLIPGVWDWWREDPEEITAPF